ncbi:hypothetical protein HK096_008714, partial [Nowakowskiella sp. JEL0078]
MVTSTNEKKFVINALKEGLRIDGRQLNDYRDIKIVFGESFGHVEILLGKTRVAAIVSGEIVRPLASNPAEGFLKFYPEFSPMASPLFEPGRFSDEEVMVSRLLEKAFKKSRAVDTEGLCIVAGEKVVIPSFQFGIIVWSVRIDIHILDHDGNLIDCACIATVSALLHFKRPDVSVSGDVVTVHDFQDKNPIPLSIHHIPVCITMSFFDGSGIMVVDPTLLEEQVQEGHITFVLNIHRELCSISKAGGCALDLETIVQCSKIA